MEFKLLSSKYQISRISEYDVNEVFNLCKMNTLFYKYCPPFVTKESIIETIELKPSGISFEDKYFLGIYNETDLIAIIDIITGYPTKDIFYIGLFMMNEKYQGKGIGTSIISDISTYAKDIGYKAIRLAYAKGNEQAKHFWLKNGFLPINIEKNMELYTAILLEKNI